MALWHEPLRHQPKVLKRGTIGRGPRVAAMWMTTTLWVIIGSSVPAIAHNLAVMIGVTLLLIGPTCCAQIGWAISGQVDRVRIDNDQYVASHTAPEVYFNAGRVYERQVNDRKDQGARTKPNVIHMKTRRTATPAPLPEWAPSETGSNSTEHSEN